MLNRQRLRQMQDPDNNPFQEELDKQKKRRLEQLREETERYRETKKQARWREYLR